MIKYKRIEFIDIVPYWNKLWGDRIHTVYSSMLMRGNHDYHIKDTYKYRCWCAYDSARKDRIVGVMAGHKSEPLCYRTRGLWVDPDYRGQGIAQGLFALAELQAKNEHCRWLWSYPRLAALPAYMKSGYVAYGEPDLGEYDHCVRAKKDLSVLTTSVWNIDDSPIEDSMWLDQINIWEMQGSLLGQNEQVRGTFIHITQHWVNEMYMQPMGAIGARENVRIVVGDLDNADHVL